MNKSKNILITGASTGIGFDLCKSFIRAGYTVFGSVRKTADADKLKGELGEQFHPLLFDVTDHEAVDKAAAEMTEKIGHEGLAGLINNAGIALGGPFAHVDIEDFRQQFEVNVIGLVKVTQAFLPLLGMRADHPSSPGKIIMMSSLTGKVAMPFISPYVGSKHALEGIAVSLRRELLLFGIDVIVVGPGAIKTPIWNKGADDPRNAAFFKTPWAESLGIFQKVFVLRSIKKGWNSDVLAEKVLTIFEKNNPKTRYALVPQRFENWTLPRLLPARRLDKMIGKGLKLLN
jgi:NAD(P)-dependent dehydrogenase (short-subunit alcohol dehydrogenase family)